MREYTDVRRTVFERFAATENNSERLFYKSAGTISVFIQLCGRATKHSEIANVAWQPQKMQFFSAHTRTRNHASQMKITKDELFEPVIFC